ncbi:Uncharacterized protein BP5553_02648 [Venustampulla echinocandica]|uniref:Mucin n=1 Tax=Venustampulla echinocandica TaxID=2656787 RepID=A0A370TS44_9HELO|nr:Uncharacterized protein BP5553_02648 [Venustampulla echinocandica]RDL38308.1 Uncharacterized protein BP5553_02648 [Venustampulla echinocandica]
MAPSRSQHRNRLEVPSSKPRYFSKSKSKTKLQSSSLCVSSSTTDLPSLILPRSLDCQTSDRPLSSPSLPRSQFDTNMSEFTGFDCTEDDFEALPLAIRRKYFSTLERLRLAERANSLALDELPIQRPRKGSLASRRNVSVTELRRKPSSSRKSRKHSLSNNEASWYLNLPPKVKRKNFTAEERVVLDGRLQDKVILDAADEAIYKASRRASRNLPTIDPFRDTSTSPSPIPSPIPSPMSNPSIHDGGDRTSSMAAAMYESFRWMDEESDLDLRLVLDDYHANLDGAVIPDSTSDRRPSFRRQMSISKIPFSSRGSLTSPKPQSPQSESPSQNHLRQRSRALSLIGPKHMIHNSISSIDPNATHYQDPEARLKLRVYLASPQKFDEAIEFGFPSMDGVTGGDDKENNAPVRSSKDVPALKSSFATDGGRSFLNDGASLFEDDVSMMDPESPITPMAIDGFHPEQPAPLSEYGAKPTQDSADYSHLGITKPVLVKQPDGYAQAMAGNREMTLRMTLTRPDLRADETALYGWQSRKGSLREASPSIAEPEKFEVRGPFGGLDGWGPVEKENGVVKRLWNKVKSSQRKGQ